MLNVMNKPIRTLLIIMLCAAALLAAAQETTAPPALPPDGQQEFDRGLMAVQLQEWDLAIRYFTSAYNTSPGVPAVLFNLGLAHDKVRGHELPAIAWLQAYLAATPQAPNAEAIRAEIERLKTVMRGKMNTIFQTAITAAQQLDPNGPFLQNKDVALHEIADSQARVGDVEGAIATRKLVNVQLKDTPKLSSEYWRVFVCRRIDYGDLERAQEALKNVTEIEDQVEVARAKERYAKEHYANSGERVVLDNSGEMVVLDWNALADSYSCTVTGDPKKALEDAAESKGQFAQHGKTAKDRIENLAMVADSLGRNLNEIIFLERKSGQERGGK